MPTLSRRDFLVATSVAGTAAMLPFPAWAKSALALPAGLQMWTVKEELAKDFTGTLKALKAIGYSRVEAAGWVGRTPAEYRKGVSDAGLECYSCHFSMRDMIDEFETKLVAAREAGATYIVASSPHSIKPIDGGRPWVRAVAEAMTLADWQRNAAAMNRIGKRAKALGMRFGYHNHPAEFLQYDGKTAFNELLRLTDPALVTFELDLGWVAAAGYDPARVIERHAARIELLHVKDIVTKVRQPGKIADDLSTVPIGAGSMNWQRIFAAAARAPIKGWFVEQEAPFEHPPLEALSQSLTYLESLRA